MHGWTDANIGTSDLSCKEGALHVIHVWSLYFYVRACANACTHMCTQKHTIHMSMLCAHSHPARSDGDQALAPAAAEREAARTTGAEEAACRGSCGTGQLNTAVISTGPTCTLYMQSFDRRGTFFDMFEIPDVHIFKCFGWFRVLPVLKSDLDNCTDVIP